ncbi:hypothetical protein DFJ74DRAFT_670393 [Hyaloraphidium curvatum]|nr:hypothetical protein DFJ74DRAFT_670393 [Hyaloraphidium curvatum]
MVLEGGCVPVVRNGSVVHRRTPTRCQSLHQWPGLGLNAVQHREASGLIVEAWGRGRGTDCSATGARRAAAAAIQGPKQLSFPSCSTSRRSGTMGYITDTYGSVNNTISFANRTLSFATKFTAARREALAQKDGYLAAEYSPDFSYGARDLRQKLMRDLALAPNQALTAQQVWDLFYPAIIFAAILFVIAGVFIPIGIYMCAKIHPALVKRFVERPKSMYKPFSCKRLWFPILVLLATLAFGLWSLVLIIHGNIEFTQNLNVAKQAEEDLFLLAQIKILGIGPVVNFMLQDLNDTVRLAMTGLAQNFNVTAVTVGITPEVNAIEASVGGAKTASGSVNGYTTALQTASGGLETTYGALNQSATGFNQRGRDGLNGPINFPGSTDTYRLQPPVAFPNAPLNPPAKVKNATDEMFAFLGNASAGLNGALAEMERRLANYSGENLARTIQQAVNNSVTAAQENLLPQVQGSIANLSNTYQSSVVPISDDLDTAAQQFDNVIGFLARIDTARSILTYVAAGLSALCLLVIFIAMFAKSPRWAGHCLLASFALGIICFIVAALYLAIGVSVGAACAAVQQDNLEALLPTINQVAGTNLVKAHVDAFRLARSECAAGTNGLQVAVDVARSLLQAGINVGLDPATLTNVQTALDRVVAAASNNATVGQAVNAGIGRVPGLVNQGLEYVNAAVDLAIDSTKVVIRQVTKPLVNQASADAYTTAQVGATGQLPGLAAPGGTAGRAQSSNPARVAEAETLLQQTAGTLNTDWNGIDAAQGASYRTAQSAVLSNANSLDASVASLEENLTALKGGATDLANTTLRLVSAEAQNFVANGLDPVTQAFSSFAESTQALLLSLTACRNIIQDTYVLQNAVCEGVLRANDELWFGFLIVAFIWTVGTLLLFYALKKVWDTDEAWRWFGREKPMASETAEKYILSDQQKQNNVEHGADWGAVGGYDAKLATNGAAPAPMADYSMPAAAPAAYPPVQVTAAAPGALEVAAPVPAPATIEITAPASAVPVVDPAKI